MKTMNMSPYYPSMRNDTDKKAVYCAKNYIITGFKLDLRGWVLN